MTHTPIAPPPTCTAKTGPISVTASDSTCGIRVVMQIPKDTVGGVYDYHRGWVGENDVVSVGFNWT